MGFQKQKAFFFLISFSYMTLACVRESVRTRDIGHDI